MGGDTRSNGADPRPHDDDRIPVTVLTGFLGSGKTTVLAKLLSDPRLNGVAVVVNEFAALGIDQLIVAAPRADTLLLAGNCMCCLPHGEFAATLRELKGRSGAGTKISRVIIETSGLADPAPILQTLIADPDVERDFRFEAVVTTVDSVNGEATLERYVSSVNQVAVADSIVLTKPDLADANGYRTLASRVCRLNPWARQYRAINGAVEQYSATTECWHGADLGYDGIAAWLAHHEPRVEAKQILRRHSNGGSNSDDGLAHRMHVHDDGIEAFTLIHQRPITDAGLRLWIDMLTAYRGAQLLRVKGLLNVDGTPVAIHAVQQIFHPPVELPDWPSDDRRSRLVFITRGMTKGDLKRTFSAFSFDVSANGFAPDSYRRFIAAMKGFRA